MNYQIKQLTIIILASTIITACSSITGSSDEGLGGTRFYSLTALPASGDNHSKLRIGVGPVEIPRLLNRPQIISRKNNTEIKMAELNQWGGSFKEELIQAITDNLSSLLKTDNIEQYPWKFAFKPNYQIRIDIERFDGEIGKYVILKARWRLLKNNQETLVKHAVIKTPIANGDKSYNSYIKALSTTLITLSQQISSQLRK